MTAFDSFPLGQPGFISHILDRAAHLRGDESKLLALEQHPEARAYVVYRDSLVVKREASGPRALLSVDEARKFGANPGTVFLGLRDGALAAVASRAGRIEVPVELTADIMPGVVSIPHGWGHSGADLQLRVAVQHAGVNSNLLADECALDPLSGNGILNGIPVSVTPAAQA